MNRRKFLAASAAIAALPASAIAQTGEPMWFDPEPMPPIDTDKRIRRFYYIGQRVLVYGRDRKGAMAGTVIDEARDWYICSLDRARSDWPHVAVRAEHLEPLEAKA